MAIGVCKGKAFGVRSIIPVWNTAWQQVSSPRLTQCSRVNRAGVCDVREADLVTKLHQDHRVRWGLDTSKGSAKERWIFPTNEWAARNREVHGVAITLDFTIAGPRCFISGSGWAEEDLAVLDVWVDPCLPLVVVDAQCKACARCWVQRSRPRWQRVVCAWVVLIVILNIHQKAKAHLLHVRQTGCLTCLFTGLCKYWEKNSCQNGNNSNHNQEFDKRKCAFSRCASHIRSPIRI